MPKNYRQSITFTNPQMRWLWNESGRLGVSVAELVRRTIDAARAPKSEKDAAE
jgi:hypothetical protein